MGIGLFVLSTAAITPLAWLSYRYVERLGIRLGRAVLHRWPEQANQPTAVLRSAS
jgi:peptidoglycan/LPS O-acetylase OafA/YrhL